MDVQEMIERLVLCQPIEYKELPSISLYMDQVSGKEKVFAGTSPASHPHVEDEAGHEYFRHRYFHIPISGEAFAGRRTEDIL